ncbi:cupin domain-containing protein [Mycolicibacterium sp. Dal123E01]|uniref:cupin domain-containing protein n=1 Tax=Mycolicibacterium sp. Dal123E01 TaxID=3457578 RepID=UPI00403EE390
MGLRAAATGCVLFVATATFGVVPANSSPIGPIAAINGTAPPGVVERLHDDSRMMDSVESDGLRHIVLMGVRRVGTRSPIHIHPVGGQTCVLAGEMTLFLEGSAAQTSRAGSCYFMPANTPMSAANLGTEDARIIDIFTLPTGEPFFVPLEPGWMVWPEPPPPSGG